jgi:hypothetical protein
MLAPLTRVSGSGVIPQHTRVLVEGSCRRRDRIDMVPTVHLPHVSAVVLLAAVLSCDCGSLAAQTTPVDTSSHASSGHSTRGEWVDASFGAATYRIRHGDGAVVLTGDDNVQRGPWLATLRGQFLYDFGETGAVSLLLGRATTSNSVGFASVSGGVTALVRRPCVVGCDLFGDVGTELGPSRGGVGVMVAGDAALRVGRAGGASIGLTGYVDLNTLKSYAGIGLEIGVGGWR